MSNFNFEQAVQHLKAGNLIAYPTEGVYGLGCDPFQQAPLDRLRALKSRPASQGLILIAAHWEQINELVDHQRLQNAQAQNVLASWPGPVTWLLPASNKAPRSITGAHDTIALRVTDHPLARQLCEAFGGPIVSTSANRRAEPPCVDADSVRSQLGHALDYILEGEVGRLAGPTTMWDAMTGQQIR